MNIWVFNHYAITPDMPGGTRHYDLGRELVRRGHKVTIFATSFHHYLHKEMRLGPREWWKIENLDNINYVWIRTPAYKRNDLSRVWNMAAFAARAWGLGRRIPKRVPEIRKPDVVIGSTVHLLAVLAAYGVAKHHKAKFVMEVRDLWPQTLIDVGQMNALNPVVAMLRWLERFLYHRAERIISLLPLAQKYITSLGISPDKIIWIPNGVDLSRFNNLVTKDDRHQDFRVVYFGAHGRANSLDVLIQAARIVQDRGCQGVRFVLIGDGPEKPQLIELAQDLGLGNVEFLPPIPKAEAPYALGRADATVLALHDSPLYKYGFSMNKLYDYLASGKPIILSGNPVVNPVEKAQCGLVVPPEDPGALADAIIKLYQMPEKERIAMGKRGRAYVEQHHDIRKLAERLENVMEEVLKNN